MAMVTAKPVSADELYRISAMHAVYDDSSTGKDEEGRIQVLEEFFFLARLHICAPQACESCKKLVQVAWEDPGGERQKQTIMETFEFLNDSAEANHGMGDFVEKGVKDIDWDAWYLRLKSRL